MVMMLRECCCGCSLQTGTIITGVLNILGGLWYLTIGMRVAEANDHFDEHTKKVLVAGGAVLAVIGAILLLIAICLIFGAQLGSPALLLLWMVYTIVFLILSTILSIVFAVQFFSTGNTSVGAELIIVVVVNFVLETYFLLVVYSLYRELKATALINLV